MSRLLDILKREAKTIADEFNLASQQGEGTPQEIADFRENAVQSFVRRFFPQSYIVSKGKITNLDGEQSDSIDCLVLNPGHPHLVDSNGKFRIIFADGCDAAIEVKPNVARLDELHRALDQCASVKLIKRSKTSILRASSCPPHIVEHSVHIPFYIFSVKAFDPLKLYTEIASYYRSKQIPLVHQVEGICILNVGILKNIKHKELNTYGADFPIGENDGWYLEKWGESSLVGFLIALEYSFSGFPAITTSIMKRVLIKIGRTDVELLGGSISVT